MKQSFKYRSGGRHGRFNGHRSNNVITRNTVFDSSGPCGRLRGTAQQLMEKYMTAAKDMKHTDRIQAEIMFQYADHYARLFAMTMNNSAENTPRTADMPLEEAPTEQQDMALPEEELVAPEAPVESDVSSASDESSALASLPFMDAVVPEEGKTKKLHIKRKASKEQPVENQD